MDYNASRPCQVELRSAPANRANAIAKPTSHNSAAHPPGPAWRHPPQQSRSLHSRPAWWLPARTSHAQSHTGCGPAQR